MGDSAHSSDEDDDDESFWYEYGPPSPSFSDSADRYPFLPYRPLDVRPDPCEHAHPTSGPQLPRKTPPDRSSEPIRRLLFIGAALHDPATFAPAASPHYKRLQKPAATSPCKPTRTGHVRGSLAAQTSGRRPPRLSADATGGGFAGAATGIRGGIPGAADAGLEAAGRSDAWECRGAGSEGGGRKRFQEL